MMNHQKLRKTVCLAILTAAAVVLHYVEGTIPVPVAIPGIKLGLSNVVSLIALYLFGPGEAFWVLLLRVMMTSFLYSGLSSLIFSLSGGLLSLLAMAAVWKLRDKGFSIVGASAGGGIFHNIGQLAAASVVLRTTAVFSYLPYLLISGLVTGIVTGVLADVLVPRLKKILTQVV